MSTLLNSAACFTFLFTFQPVTNNNPWMLLYFISFLLIVSFFVLNMFVGVVVENFHKCRQHQEAEEARRREEKRLRRLEKKRRSKEQPKWFFCLFVGQGFVRQILFHYKPDVHVYILEPYDGNLLRCYQMCSWPFPFFISRRELFIFCWALKAADLLTTLIDFVLVHFHTRNLLRMLVHPIFVVSR